MARRVVAGVDGTLIATRALNWAADEAERRSAGLRAVHAAGTAQEASPVLASAVSWIRRRNPGLPVEGVAARDGAVRALARESGEALLTVVGNRGFGAAGGLLASSVGQGLARSALGPLAVVRGGRTRGRDILLGLEGVGDEQAAAWAFREAALRGARLRVLHTWSEHGPALPQDPLRGTTSTGTRRGPAPVRTLARLRERHPDVAVETGAVLGGAAHALLDATHDAALVVVATHRRAGAKGPRTGPLTRALLQGSHCPVVLVPPGREDRAAGRRTGAVEGVGAEGAAAV
jgi:nucleotide-binding universal stress UspA family protein